MDACDDIDINSRRTRINIATSCISTIFLCTWVAIHPNIPNPDEPRWKVIRRRIGCMIGGILAPEIYVLLAARQFVAASAFAKAYQRMGWTLTHGFFALMGGFMVYNDGTPDKIGFYDLEERADPLVDAFIRDFISLEGFELRLAAQHVKPSNRCSPTQGFEHSLAALKTVISKPATPKVTLSQVTQNSFPSIGLCISQVIWYNEKLTERGMDTILSSYLRDEDERRLLNGILTFLEASERDAIATAQGKSENTDYANSMEISDRTKGSTSGHTPDPSIENSRLRNLVPRINEQDIQDKSKSDILTKTIALFQVAWFIIQLCARYHENLAITELEIFTLAFCVLNFATYALWWKKPFAVDRGYAIRWRDGDWEVIVPPFVKMDEVPWYQWYLALMLGVRKGIKQVLTLHFTFRMGPSAYRQVPDSGLETHGDPSLPPPSAETTSSSSRRYVQSLWKKIKHSMSSFLATILSALEVVFIRLTRGETKLHDSGKRVSTFSPTMMKLEGSNAFKYYLSGCFLILVFGSIHFLAWSSGPTNTDKLVWRICSICVTVLPVIVFLFERYTEITGNSDYEVVNIIASIPFFISLTTPLFYILARAGLLLLVVRSLIYCPPSALQAVSWSQLIPHV